MRIRTIILTLIGFLTLLDLSGQSLKGLSENPVIKKFRSAEFYIKKSAAASAENSLPFFEDFSTSEVFPDPLKWEDNKAFVNTSFAVDPVSIGVATLDAIDENGDIYAINDFPVTSDELTSRPFNLEPYAATDDIIRLSFFFQSGGYGEVPEINDSLLLEFYSVSDNRWYKAWHTEKDAFTDFEQVIIPISESFYQDGFRFRFRNYTSMSVNDVIGGRGALSNVDCWNIDYIMMNTETVIQHQSIEDITLVDPPRYLMDFYEIVPWSHLNDAQSITRNNLRYVIRNLELTGDSVNVGRSYYVRDINSGVVEYAEQSFGKFGPNTLERRTDPFFAPFTNPGTSDEGLLEVGAYLITPANQFKSNDTAKTYLSFKDYYAYDDGIPEYGFGISGESTSGALLAYRFRVYRTDTLQAVDIFFNRTRDNYTSDLKFHICVWADDNGQPGEILYFSPEEYSPEHEGFLEPVRYPLQAGTGLLVEDSIVYVGWQQRSEEFLNVGYDVNRNSLEKIFVNITGDWFNPGASIIPGSLMIRPVFGGNQIITHTFDYNENLHDVLIYPNPVSDQLYIQAGDFVVEKVIVYDALGRPVLTDSSQSDRIDVSALGDGIYYIRLTGTNGKIFVRKVIISH